MFILTSILNLKYLYNRSYCSLNSTEIKNDQKEQPVQNDVLNEYNSTRIHLNNNLFCAILCLLNFLINILIYDLVIRINYNGNNVLGNYQFIIKHLFIPILVMSLFTILMYKYISPVNNRFITRKQWIIRIFISYLFTMLIFIIIFTSSINNGEDILTKIYNLNDFNQYQIYIEKITLGTLFYADSHHKKLFAAINFQITYNILLFYVVLNIFHRIYNNQNK